LEGKQICEQYQRLIFSIPLGANDIADKRRPEQQCRTEKLMPIILTNLVNRTMSQAIFTFLTKPENLNSAAMKTRSGAKAGYVLHLLSNF